MAKQQLLTCYCLNVQIIEDLQTDNEEEISDEKFINDSDDSDDFLINSKLIKIRPGGIKINYEYLCLKRIAGENLQIIFCAICEKETHAILISKSSNYRNNDENLMPQSVLVNRSLLDDKQKIADLKSSPYYSPALNIVLPERLICYTDLNDIKTDIGKTFNYDNSFFFISSYIQVDIADKIKSFLQQEKTFMKDRIKRFSFEEEKCFKELAQTTQDHRQSFLRMINAIKYRHNIDNDFDKENYLQPIQAPASKEINMKYFQAKKNSFDESQTNNKAGKAKKGDDIDCLFDIDDIDAFAGNGLNLEPKVIQSDDDINDDNLNDVESQATTTTAAAVAAAAAAASQKQPILNETEYELEEQNTVFPLKEFNNTFSNGNLINEETYSQSALPDLAEHHSYRQQRQRQSKMKNINKSTSTNDGQFQVANSLPIQIPHFSRCKTDREIEKSFRLNPGESIADSIQKLARSVRNENDILDDRPRRRLNTGDLIKSRPFFN